MKATQEEVKRIESIAKAVATKHGYENVSAHFVDFTEFKMRWQRTYKSVNFEVSDYLVGAPDDVIEDIFEVVCSKFEGNTDRTYKSSTGKYLCDPHFAGAHRRTFLARKKSVAKKYTTFKGTAVHFSKTPFVMHQLAQSSALMNVIVLNKEFENESEDFILNAIKHEYNKIQSGREMFGQTPKYVEYDRSVIADYI